MHNLLLALTTNQEGDTSETVRSRVYNHLLDDSSFLSEGGGHFGGSVADWFVIGGRWSGELTESLLDQEKLEKFYKDFEDKHGWWTSRDVSQDDRRKQAAEMFKQYFPDFKGELPVWRDSYSQEGYSDDAALLTPELYKALGLEKYEGDDTARDKEWNMPVFVDIEYDVLDKSAIGSKWVVIVDYHS